MTKRDDMRADALLVEALRSSRPEVPGLGPARLELERRRLVARLAAGERARAASISFALRPRFAAAAAVLLLAVGAAIALYAVRAEEPAVSLSGSWRLERGDAIANGALVRIPAGSRALLMLEDGTRIAADGGSTLRFAAGAGIEVRLYRGRIAAEVSKRKPPAGAFVVATEFGDVAVMGTVFAVAVDGEGATVRLYEGRVKLTAGSREIALAPGHSAHATGDGITSLGGLPHGDESADLALLGVAPGARVTPIAASAAAARAPALASTAAGPEEKPDARALAPSPSRAERDPVARLSSMWREGRFAEIVSATDAPDTRPAALLYRGKAFGALGRWREAGGAFAGAAAAGGDLGREALYLSAAAYDTAGDFASGLAMAERAASSGGPNADHASRLVFVSLSGLGRYADAAAAAEEYLKIHPSGAHVAEARFAASTGARLARRWEDAARGYAEFLSLGRGAPQMRDDAAFYVGYCRWMAGATASGREGLESYLASYPSGRHAEQARAALTN
jgi:hypothetical protein